MRRAETRLRTESPLKTVRGVNEKSSVTNRHMEGEKNVTASDDLYNLQDKRRKKVFKQEQICEYAF